MSQSSKLYKVKLAQGFNAAGRRRAGVVAEKGVTQVLELTDEQVKELEQDVWFVVAEAGKDDKPGSVTETPGANSDEEEVVTDPYEGKKLTDLQAMAEEAGVDVTGIRSKQGVIDALEAAKAAPEEDEDDSDEEEVELSEDMTVEELKQIAETQGVQDLDQYTEDNKAELIKAIEEASANTEE